MVPAVQEDRRSLSTGRPRDRATLYVTGGQQRSLTETDEWRQYGKGLIARVDPVSAEATCCVEYVSPPEVCADEEPSISFKAASRDGSRLLVCTSTEILAYELPGFDRVAYVSLPCFNDLHHVAPTPDGTWLVANTGLDMVLEIHPDGRIHREWDVLGREVWTHFSRHVDYRKVATTKPHRAHPNHVFRVDDETWVTRFQQRDAVCLNGCGRRMAIEIQRPHDGTPFGDHVYFTTVDGHVVIVNRVTRRTDEIVDLNPDQRYGAHLGWCRGLHVMGNGLAWVGFSRFRPTKFLEHVSWIRSGFRHRRRATHIALYDLCRKERIAEVDLEACGVHTIFSVVGASV
jgi:hypothetical protein